jgi:hypothetical protein
MLANILAVIIIVLIITSIVGFPSSSEVIGLLGWFIVLILIALAYAFFYINFIMVKKGGKK